MFISGYLNKHADKISDAVIPAVAHTIAGPLAPVTSGIDALAMMSAPADKPIGQETSGPGALASAIPGVGGRRMGKRLQETVDIAKAVDPRTHAEQNARDETLGAIITSLLTGSAGYGLARAAGAQSPKTVALASAAVPLAIASVLAALTRNRTLAGQIEHDTQSHALRDLLVPGAAEYDKWKRYGVSDELRREFS